VSPALGASPASDPRHVRIAGHRVNAYKVFLCIGLYVGILASAASAQASGLSPLRVGAGALVCALIALAGARAYHVAVNPRVYRRAGLWRALRDTEGGGWSLFGALAIVPFTLARDAILGTPVAVFWDHMAVGIAVGGAWIRFGCVRNGCCVGRPSGAWFARMQHDVHGRSQRRIPVEWLEIGWWIAAALGLLWLRPLRVAPGSCALALLAWYGFGRFWLEPLRENPSIVCGRVRVDQVVAAALAVGAGTGLLLLASEIHPLVTPEMPSWRTP